MFGYLSDKSEFLNRNSYVYYLQKAVALSGGTQYHYNFFNNLITYSLINENTNNPITDTRVGQHLLFLFPFKLQVLLSLICYFEEQRIFTTSEYNINPDINLPSYNLRLTSSLTQKAISPSTLESIDSISEFESLSDSTIQTIKLAFFIEEPIELLTNEFEDNIYNLFNMFDVNQKEDLSKIIISNNRLRAGILIAKYLKYNNRSINYLSQSINLWLEQSLNT